MSTLRKLGEFAFIARATQGLPSHADILEAIGDDCAVVRTQGATLLLSCDAAVEDVHFSFDTAAPEDVGYKSATAAISDIAAMGGAPRFMLVAAALPPDMPVERADALFDGLKGAARRHGVLLIGGDTTQSPGGVFLDITVIGEPVSGRYMPRHGAKPGDLLAVTGFPGRSAGGLFALQMKLDAPELVRAHLRPNARVQEGQWLARQPEVRAMIDLSDGLVQDAGHLAEAGGLGVDIALDNLPVAPELRRYKERLGANLRDLILAGGEEYELVIALAPEAHEGLAKAFEAEFGLPLTVVGRFTDAWKGARIEGQDCGQIGYDHFRT